MAAQTADRTCVFIGEYATPPYLLGADARAYYGALMMTVGGFAVPASDDVPGAVVGVCRYGGDNAGGGDGAKTIRVARGAIVDFRTEGPEAITQDDVGRPCYVLDDNTVVREAGTVNRNLAGEVMRLEGGKVFVLVPSKA